MLELGMTNGPKRTVAGIEEYVFLTRGCGVDPGTINFEIRNIFSGAPVSRQAKQFRSPQAVSNAAPSRRTWFLVLCEGRAGSRWLASSLHLHPEIACSVGVDHPCYGLAFYYNADEQRAVRQFSAANGPISLGIEFIARRVKRALEDDGLRATFCVREWQKNSLWVFDELDALTDAGVLGGPAALGNVHGVQGHELASCRDEFGDPFKGREPVIAQLIRHPVTRFESRLSAHVRFFERGLLAESECQHIQRFCDEHATELRGIEREFAVDFTALRPRMLFYLSRRCEYQRAWATEIVAFDVENLLFERLRNDRDYYAWAVSYLTRNRVKPDAAYLDLVFDRDNLTRSRGEEVAATEPPPPAPLQQFALWSDWERHVFREEVRRYGLQHIYSRVGYDLSFAV